MNKKLKIIIALLILVTIPIGWKGLVKSIQGHQLTTLVESIREKKVCSTEANLLDCAHQRYLSIAGSALDPLRGQEFFSEIVKIELEKTPEKARYLKDQYFIFTAELYLRSLKERQQSLLGKVPFINQRNVDVHTAKMFLKGMEDYSNRREVDRTIASETILQEVSNFNAAMTELSQAINHFN